MKLQTCPLEVLNEKKIEFAGYISKRSSSDQISTQIQTSLKEPLRILSRSIEIIPEKRFRLSINNPIRVLLGYYARTAAMASCLNHLNDKYDRKFYAKVLVDPLNPGIFDILFRGQEISSNFRKSIRKMFHYPGVKGAMVDEEFYEQFLLAWPSLEKKIMKKHRLISSINFVGHGVGGVYAMLAALEITKKLQSSYTIAVFTFGQPRLGNFQFAQYVNELLTNSVYRVTNMNDFVPKYPKPTETQSWLHYGTEYWIKQENCECFIKGKMSSAVYKCVGTRTDQQKFLESEFCNSRAIGGLVTSERNHKGPYFYFATLPPKSTLMSNCPPMF
ncbi:hypothetical protein G9A89_009846 [Geosiphon pyriformis]|nr:hypothetical protein G9A89_009846 [Geosiphon pyriformis]